MTRWILAFLVLLASSGQAQKSGHSANPANSTAATVASPTWVTDSSRSKLTFNLRHFLKRVEGRFDAWSATLTVPSENDWRNATVEAVIQASSINTENESRDDHLRSDDFFDAEKYPTITFKSTSVRRDGDSLTVTGNLTMKGITKSVVLKGKYLGTSGPTPHMTFDATTTINRVDYGITYNRLAEGSGTMLGDDVTINLTIAATRKS